MFQILLLLLLAMGKGYHPVGYEPVLKMLNDLYLEEFIELFTGFTGLFRGCRVPSPGS